MPLDTSPKINAHFRSKNAHLNSFLLLLYFLPLFHSNFIHSSVVFFIKLFVNKEQNFARTETGYLRLVQNNEYLERRDKCYDSLGTVTTKKDQQDQPFEFGVRKRERDREREMYVSRILGPYKNIIKRRALRLSCKNLINFNLILMPETSFIRTISSLVCS